MRIEIRQNGQVIERRDFSDGSYAIGRGASSAIKLNSPQVSKSHALLVVKGGRAAIVDVGSSNGIFVNGILIKKTRIDIGDEVVIGPFRLKPIPMLDRPESNEPSLRQGSRIAIEGATARKIDHSGEPAERAPIVKANERILSVMDKQILVPFYALIKNYDWRLVTASIVGGALVLAVALSALPFVNWGRKVLITESLARGQAILRQAVRENYRALEKTSDFTRLTMDLAEKESGVLGAYIADPSTRNLVAPAKFFNKPINDLYVIRAIEKLVKDPTIEETMVERNDGVYILAQPIFQYAAEGERAIVGVALLEFQLSGEIHTTFTPVAEMVLLAILLGLIAFFLITKMFSFPVGRMVDQLDSALKGDGTSLTAEVAFPELQLLAQNINFALARLKSGGDQVASTDNNDPEAEDAVLQKIVEAFDSTTSDAVLLMDIDKRVRFVGQVTEELLSMRSQYAIGQNISEACRDQSFSGTAIDMVERVLQSLGEKQVSDLEINGVSRNMTCVALRNGKAEIRYLLLTVKMNG